MIEGLEEADIEMQNEINYLREKQQQVELKVESDKNDSDNQFGEFNKKLSHIQEELSQYQLTCHSEFFRIKQSSYKIQTNEKQLLAAKAKISKHTVGT